MKSKVTIVNLFPDLLGTYGDIGNAKAILARATLRGIEAEIINVTDSEALPQWGDIYLLGGGEDMPQVRALENLAKLRSFASGHKEQVIFAVCAGFQILGQSFVAGFKTYSGLNLLPVVTQQTATMRAVGEVVGIFNPLFKNAFCINDPVVIGYENHLGTTSIVDSQAQVVSSINLGVGNSWGEKADGCFLGNIIGTYLHGPCLVRNPQLCDALLKKVVGELPQLDDVDEISQKLREERLKTLRVKIRI